MDVVLDNTFEELMDLIFEGVVVEVCEVMLEALLGKMLEPDTLDLEGVPFMLKPVLDVESLLEALLKKMLVLDTPDLEGVPLMLKPVLDEEESLMEALLGKMLVDTLVLEDVPQIDLEGVPSMLKPVLDEEESLLEALLERMLEVDTLVLEDVPQILELILDTEESQLEKLLKTVLNFRTLDPQGVPLLLDLVLGMEQMLLDSLPNAARLAFEASETVIQSGGIEAELGAAVLFSENLVMFVIFESTDVAFALSMLERVVGGNPTVTESLPLNDGLIIGSVVCLVVGRTVVSIVGCSDVASPGTRT